VGAVNIVLIVISIICLRPTTQFVRLPAAACRLARGRIWQQRLMPPMIENPAVLSETPIFVRWERLGSRR